MELEKRQKQFTDSLDLQQRCFESALHNIELRWQRMDERMEKIMNAVIDKLQEIHDDTSSLKETIDRLSDDERWRHSGFLNNPNTPSKTSSSP